MWRIPGGLMIGWLFLVLASSSLWSGTALESQMNTMKVALRTLKLDLQAPVESEKGKYLGYADTLLSAAAKAKEFEPKMTAKISEAERAQFLAAYRKSIEGLIVLLEQLKKQLNSGDWEAARAQIRLINRAQGEGHEKFRDENPW